MALGVFFALVLLEVGIRVSFLAEHPLSVTAETFPPPPSPDCKGENAATLGHLVRPSDVADLVYELKPDIHTCYYGARVDTNSQSIRAERDYEIPKPPNTYRILLLGDSQTFGQGVNFDETFGQILEKKLNEASKGPVVEVLNGGVDGYNTAQEAAFFVHRGLRFEPDLVLILFIANDFEYANFVSGIQDHLATDRLFLLSKVTGDRGARIPERYKQQTGQTGYERALTTIGETADQHGITVVNCFALRDRGNSGDEIDWEEIDALQARLGIHILPFDMPWGPEYWVSEDNRHLNPAATKLVAEQMLEGLKQQNLVFPEIQK